MRFPIKNKHGKNILTLPNLTGGLNCRDGITDILDNQLTDCKNVWNKNGILKTRPPAKGNPLTLLDTGNTDDIFVGQPKIHSDIKYYSGTRLYVLFSSEGHDENKGKFVIKFWYQSEDDFIPLPDIVSTYPGTDDEENSYIVFEKNKIIYCITKYSEIYKYLGGNVSNWQQANNDTYIPTVTVGGTAVNGKALNMGVQYEPYNLISDRCKMRFSTVDITRDSTPMEYALITRVSEYNGESPCIYAGKEIIVRYKQKNGNSYTHSLTINNGGTGTETEFKGDNLKIALTSNNTIKFIDSTGEIKSVITYVEDNMEIELPCEIVDNSVPDKVYKMKRSILYGGSANGINGGSRLFLYGNENEKNLVIWSANDNPLYFPENNYYYVGSQLSSVTAIGRQDDKLIIFKEYETYYSYHVHNGNITGEDLENQSVVDIEAQSDYFPLIQLNASIGCDVPDSVQLCRNRLVWAHTNGKIYTLVTNDQYNERAIFEVSGMVENKIKIPKNATSADFEGYYFLNCSGDIWLMDYNSNGYQYIYSYSKNEDASLKIPWYRWEIKDNRVKYYVLSAVENSLFSMLSYQAGAIQKVFLRKFDLTATDNKDSILHGTYIVDISTDIISEIKTKIFDFDAPFREKNVIAVNCGIGDNGGENIEVTFITDCGTEESEIILSGNDMSEYTPAHIKVHNLYPTAKHILRFGLLFKSSGKISLDKINITFIGLGGAK